MIISHVLGLSLSALFEGIGQNVPTGTDIFDESMEIHINGNLLRDVFQVLKKYKIDNSEKTE